MSEFSGKRRKEVLESLEKEQLDLLVIGEVLPVPEFH